MEADFRVLGHGYRASWCRACENAPQRRRPRPTPHQRRVLVAAAGQADGLVHIPNRKTAAALLDERLIVLAEAAMGRGLMGSVYRITEKGLSQLIGGAA